MDFIGHKLRQYFRTEVQGVENVPENGPCIIIPNHSGFMAFDALVIKDILKTERHRSGKLFAHRAYFDLATMIKKTSQKLGLNRADFESGIKLLSDDHAVILFPEAEAGNFKSSLKKYRLKKFHTGFVRLAILTKSPVVPCVVLGAEESNFNVGNINLSQFIPNTRIPIPLNLPPLPAKWKISFLEPIDLSGHEQIHAYNKELVADIAEEIRQKIQAHLDAELKNRKYIYFPGL